MKFLYVSNDRYINIDTIASFEIKPRGDGYGVVITTKRQEKLAGFHMTKKQIDELVSAV